MKWPRQLKLPNGETVQVKLVSKKTLGGALGDYGNGVIRIWRGLKGSSRWTVLLHEILHLCWERTNRDGIALEEELVLKLEVVLYDVLTENFNFGPD